MSQEQVRAGDFTVLIVEDNETIRMSLVMVLTNQMGVHVLEAADGQQGLVMALNERPDLILLDGRLPQLDGAQIAQELHSYFDGDGPVLIGISGEDEDSGIRRRMQPLCAHFLSKPFSLDLLLKAVRQYLPAAMVETSHRLTARV